LRTRNQRVASLLLTQLRSDRLTLKGIRDGSFRRSVSEKASLRSPGTDRGADNEMCNGRGVDRFEVRSVLS